MSSSSVNANLVRWATATRRAAMVASAVVMAVATCSCATAGKDGKLGYLYDRPDGPFITAGSVRPVALGTEVVLLVSPLAGELEVVVDGASSSDSAVARVVGTDADRVTIETLAAGTAEISTVTNVGKDRIDIEVSEVGRVEVTHWTRTWVQADGQPVEIAFVAGGTGRFIVTAFADGEEGAQLFGTGTGASVSTSQGASLSREKGDQHHVNVTFHTPGKAELETSSGEIVIFGVIDLTEVEDLRAVSVTAGEIKDVLSLTVGENQMVVVVGSTKSGAKVLLGDAVTIGSATPKTCEIGQDEWLRRGFGDGLYAIRPVATGACGIEITLGDLSASLSYPVTPKQEKATQK